MQLPCFGDGLLMHFKPGLVHRLTMSSLHFITPSRHDMANVL